MAHDIAASSQPSVLGYRSSSPYLLAQDHITSRHIPVISVPDILEACQQAQPSSNLSDNGVRNAGSDLWELPELKWLDPPDNGVLSENLPESHQLLGRFPLDGQRWPLSALYCNNRVAASTADGSAQLSFLTTSPASSGSSVVPPKNNRGLSPMSTMTNVVSKDFPSSSVSQASEWCNHNIAGSSKGSHKRAAPCEGPDLDRSPERSNSDGPTFKVGPQAHKSSSPKRLIPNSEVSALTAAQYPKDKRSRQQQTVVALGGGAGSRKGSSKVNNQRMKTEKGCSSPGRESKKSAATPSDHDIHIWTERERRKKMNGMFSTLHSLIPHLTSKADKTTIVDEAINYIQSLEATVKGLLKRNCHSLGSSSMMPSSLSVHQAPQNVSTLELEKLLPVMTFDEDIKPSVRSMNATPSEYNFQTLCSPNLVLNVCGTNSFLTICSPRGRLGLLCRILFVMDKHSLHVLNAHISSTDDTVLYMIHAQNSDPSKHLANMDLLKIAMQELRSCLAT